MEKIILAIAIFLILPETNVPSLFCPFTRKWALAISFSFRSKGLCRKKFVRKFIRFHVMPPQ